MKIEAGWNLIQRWGRRALSRAASIGSHFFVIVWLFNINHKKGRARERRPRSNPILEPLNNR